MSAEDGGLLQCHAVGYVSLMSIFKDADLGEQQFAFHRSYQLVEIQFVLRQAAELPLKVWVSTSFG